MAIKIQTEKPVIDIELGSLKLEFPTDDESIKRLRETIPQMQKGIENKETVSDAEDHAMAKQIMKQGYDVVFGKGTFDKVYKEYPSIQLCTKYYVQIAEGIKEELEDKSMDIQRLDKAKEYLNKK